LLPPSSVIGVLVNPNNPNAASDTGETKAAAASLRLQVHIVHAAAEGDIDAAFDDLARARAAALLVFPDTLFIDVRGRLAEIAAARKLPATYSNRLYVEDGGLIREAGIYTGRILRGEKPSDLPIVQPTKFELVINLKTAKALGLDLPPTLLALADEVIE
jgi:putative tryptophan/tyrosine transport system substrate-binding protein